MLGLKLNHVSKRGHRPLSEPVAPSLLPHWRYHSHWMLGRLFFPFCSRSNVFPLCKDFECWVKDEKDNTCAAIITISTVNHFSSFFVLLFDMCIFLYCFTFVLNEYKESNNKKYYNVERHHSRQHKFCKWQTHRWTSLTKIFIFESSCVK